MWIVYLQGPGTNMIIRNIQNAIDAGRAAVSEPNIAEDKVSTPLFSRALIHMDDTLTHVASLDDHRALCKQAGQRCLVIANRFPDALLIQKETVFEYAPLDVQSIHDVGAGPNLAQEYLIQRLLHIVEFWQVIACDWHGNRADEVSRLAAKLAPENSVLRATGWI